VTTLRIRVPHYLPVMAALAATLTLAACGVKGGLEPPPSAAAQAQQRPLPPEPAIESRSPGAPPSAANLAGQPTGSNSLNTTSAAVAQAPAASRSNPLDWLIK
jgi:predicted small lipoprotein YifL